MLQSPTVHQQFGTLIPAKLMLTVVNSNTVRRGRSRVKNGTSTSWESVDLNGEEYFKLDKLPTSTKRRVQQALGDIETIALLGLLNPLANDAITPDDGDFFREHPARLTPDRIAELCEACGWLRALSAEQGRDHFASKAAYHDAAIKCLQVRALYGLKISGTSSLRRRLKQWADHGHASMVSKKWGNLNKQKHDEVARDFVIDRLVDLYSDATKLTVVSTAAILNDELEEQGLETLTTERCRQILKMPVNKHKWSELRHGSRASRELSEHVIKRRRPRLPDAMWSIDGTPVELYAADGRKLYRPWYIVAVIDVATGCAVGFALGQSETSALVVRAIREAVRRAGSSPRVMHYDGAKANDAHETKAVLKALKTVGIKAQPYNGKSKHVEGFFAEWQERYLSTARNYSGSGVTAPSIESKANPDALKASLKAGATPCEEQVADQIKAFIDLYNATTPNGKSQTRLEAYMGLDESRRRKLSDQAISDAFWVPRKKQLRYNPKGLIMQVGQERFTYEVEQAEGIESQQFRTDHLGERFEVRYDPEDLNAVGLYKDGAWVALASIKYAFETVVTELTPDERARLHIALRARKTWQERGREQGEAARERMRGMGMATPDPELLHKDAANQLTADTKELLSGIALDRYEQALTTAPQQVLAKADQPTADDAAPIDFSSPFRAPDDVLERMAKGIAVDND